MFDREFMQGRVDGRLAEIHELVDLAKKELHAEIDKALADETNQLLRDLVSRVGNIEEQLRDKDTAAEEAD